MSLRCMTVAATLVIQGALAWAQLNPETKRFYDRRNEFGSKIKPLVNSCKTAEPKTDIVRRGKVSVWTLDAAKPDSDPYLSGADNSIPFELRARIEDRPLKSPITVVLITSEVKTKQGSYLISGDAYSSRYDLCIAYWPSLEVVGKTTFTATPPSTKSMYSTVSEENGRALGKWIGEWLK